MAQDQNPYPNRYILGTDDHAATGFDAHSREEAIAQAREAGFTGKIWLWGTRYRSRTGELLP